MSYQKLRSILLLIGLLPIQAWVPYQHANTLRTIRRTSPSDSTMALNAQAGFGISSKDVTIQAVSDAANEALEKCPNPTIAFISSTVKRDSESVRAEFVKHLPKGTQIHGITSSGAILTTGGANAGAVGCLLLSGEEGSFKTAYHPEDGAAAAKSLKARMPNPQAIYMSATPGAEEGVIEALAAEFPDVPVFGGTAADDELAGAWAVMSDEGVSGTGVSLVGIGESVKFGASMIGPYTTTRKHAKATKSEGRRVFEIDGKPAADWVFDWLGEEVREQYENGGLVLPQTAQKPIGIKQPSAGGLGTKVASALGSADYVTCHCAAFGGKEKYVDFFTPIPEGSELVVMESGDGPSTGYASALSDAFDVAKSNGSMDGNDPTAGILVFCGGMAIAVGDNLDSGLTSEGFASKFEGIPMMGMTCFGEQAHLPRAQKNAQRNLSVGVVLFG